MTTPTVDQPLPTAEAALGQLHAANGISPGRPEPAYRLCPRLGTAADPETAYNFPAELNHCYQVTPPTSIQLPHQINYCLSPHHVRCPLYRHHQPVVLPSRRHKLRKLRFWSSKPRQPASPRNKRPFIRLIPVLFFVAAAFLLAAGWYYRVGIAAWLPPSTRLPAVALNSPLPTPTGEPAVSLPPATNTPTLTPSPTPTQTPTPTPTPTRRPSRTPTPSPPASPTPAATESPTTAVATVSATPSPAAAGCPPPDGWIPYTVQSGDSLFRLGQRFGVPYPQLQAANCMGTTKAIYTGQILYVPNQTPPATAGPTPSPPADTSSFSPWQLDS